MNLLLLLILPFIAACIIALVGRFSQRAVPYLAAFTMIACGSMLISIGMESEWQNPSNAVWIAEWNQTWIYTIGAQFHLGLDGLSIVFIGLLYITGLSGVYISTRTNASYSSLYYAMMLVLIGCMTGVFLAVDLLLFFIFFELMLLPIYFFVVLWGGERKTYSGIQFLIFTQASGLFLLIGILVLYFNAHAAAGIYSFDSIWLKSVALSDSVETICAIGFALAFLVKLPAFPFHVWIPTLFKEAPLPALMIGIMVKTGVYGLLRFVLFLFPIGAMQIAPVMMSLGIVSMFYGAFAAFRQDDVREMLAYIVLSHMGFVLLGIFSLSSFSTAGIVLLIASEAISIAGILMLFHERELFSLQFDIARMGGLLRLPRLSLCGFALVLASIGLPFFGNFIGEWLVLIGIFSVNKFAASIALIGILCVSSVYLWLLYRVFFGPHKDVSLVGDVKKINVSVYAVLVALLVICGLAPNMVIDLVKPMQSSVTNSTNELSMLSGEVHD